MTSSPILALSSGQSSARRAIEEAVLWRSYCYKVRPLAAILVFFSGNFFSGTFALDFELDLSLEESRRLKMFEGGIFFYATGSLESDLEPVLLVCDSLLLAEFSRIFISWL